MDSWAATELPTKPSISRRQDSRSLLDAAIWGANYGERLAKQYARCVAGPSIAMRIQLAADIA
ncbi:ADP-ribosylglycohydrolase family protein, partial [Escherichia sp. TWPC-MK]